MKYYTLFLISVILLLSSSQLVAVEEETPAIGIDAQEPNHAEPEPPIPTDYSGKPVYLKPRAFVPPAGIDPELLRYIKPKFHAIIQFKRIPTEKERKELESFGTRVLGYIPENSWYASVVEETIDEIAAEPYVYYIGPVSPASKNGAYLDDNNGQWALDGEGNVFLTAVFYGDVPFDEAAEIVERYGLVINQIPELSALTVKIPLGAIADFIEEDAVQWIELVPPKPESKMDQARIRIDVNRIQVPPYDLHGRGINAMLYEVDAPFSHDDFSARLSTNDTNCNLFDDNHATRTAGILVGDGTRNNNFRGVATQADITAYCLPGDIPAMISDIRSALWLANPVKVSSNSWGDPTNVTSCPMFGSYTLESQLFDQIVRGSQGARLPWVHAAGNERGYCPNPDYDTILSQATAKNVISVGGTNTDDDSNYIFGSWGPTDDGRLKPEIAAPACELGGDEGITTTNASNTYDAECGTSFAVPQAAGASVLMLEQYRRLYSREPLPSTYKATLLQTARDINTTGPDYRTGYGILNITGAINLIRESVVSGNIIEQDINHNGEHTYFINVKAGDTIKITLAWDDSPGTPAPPLLRQLVNNLDLIVISPTGEWRFPWTLNPASPTTPARRDRSDDLNNVEQVVVDNAQAGVWKVIVLGMNVPASPQTYSLVLSHRPSNPINVVQVLDRSGSMTGQKIADAKSGATLFVDLMNVSEGIGIVDFDNIVTVTYPLTKITGELEKNAAKAAIASLFARGTTNIGGGLRAGLNEIIRYCNIIAPTELKPYCSRAIILLSDGRHNTGEHPRTVIPDLVANRVKVYAIGLGADVDQRLMSDIAQATGGAYRFANNSGILRTIDKEILDELRGHEQMLRVQALINPGEPPQRHPVAIDPGLVQATFSVIWSGSGTLGLSLADPSGRIIEETTTDPNIVFASLPGYKEFAISGPQPGTWQMDVSGVQLPGPTSYTALVSGSSVLQFAATTDRTLYYAGSHIRMTASVTSQGRLTSASATVTYPSGTSIQVLLYDDGTHGDLVPNDGTFTYALATSRGQEGSYTLNIQGVGVINNSPFTRMREFSVFVAPSTLFVVGEPTLGNQISLALDEPNRPNAQYVLALSLGDRPGIPLGDGRIILLNPDPILLLTLENPQTVGLQNNIGILNAQGQATARWTIPYIPELVGFTLYAAFITFDPALPMPQTITSISPAIPVTLLPPPISGESLVIKNATLPSGRYALSCAENSATHKIYCLGGTPYGYGGIDQVVEYNPANDILTVKSATLPSGRSYLSCAENSATNKIYCFGGWDGSSNINQILEYNPANDTLVTKSATLPSIRHGLSCAENSATNKIYCFGGSDHAAMFNQILEYTPASNLLTLKSATFPTGRVYLSCAENSATHKIYCFSGYPISGSEIVEYNPANDTLVTKSATLPSIRHGLSCAENSATNKIYCFGGEGTDQIVEYEPANDRIAVRSITLPSVRAQLSCTENSATHKSYCFGGAVSGLPLTQIVEYTIGEEQNSIGYWRLDEGSGTVARDSSGNGNTGTLMNDPIWTAGRVGNALRFDGINDYIQIPDSATLDITSQLTIEAWVKRLTSGTNHFIVGKRDAGGDTANYQLAFIGDKLSFYWNQLGAFASRYDSVNAFTDGNWHHYAVTYANDGVSVPILYRDGRSIPGEWVHGGPDTLVANNVPVTIGTIYPLQGFFNGVIDEVRIYNRSLSAAEIYEHYSRP